MKLIRMAASFGCLEREILELSEGLNLLYAPNGSGKSTWCALLRAMLYGLDTKARDKKGNPAEKNRYRPWSGLPMEGLLECEKDGRHLILRRVTASGVPMGDFSAVYADTGLPVSGLTGENAGEVLFGVGRDVFDRSVFLRQSGLAVDQSQELEKRIASLVSSGEETVSWTEADACLRAWQRKRQYHKSGLIPQLEEEEGDLLDQLSRQDHLREEIQELRDEISSVQAEKAAQNQESMQKTQDSIERAENRRAEAASDLEEAERLVAELESRRVDFKDQTPESIEEKIPALEARIRRRNRGLILYSVAALAVVVLGIIFALHPSIVGVIPIPILCGGIAFLGLIHIILSYRRGLGNFRDKRELTLLRKNRETLLELLPLLNAAQHRRENAQKLVEALDETGLPTSESGNGDTAQQETRLAHLLGRQEEMGDPAILDARLEELREQLAAAREEESAISLALDTLAEADQELHSRFSPALNAAAARYFSQLTGGTYGSVTLSREFTADVRADGDITPRPAYMLSRGTADQLYLAVRLAIADLALPPDTPLILDDALTAFDDTRLALALDCLMEVSQKRQILLFTCHRREEFYLSKKPGVHVVPLKNS